MLGKSEASNKSGAYVLDPKFDLPGEDLGYRAKPWAIKDCGICGEPIISDLARLNRHNMRQHGY